MEKIYGKITSEIYYNDTNAFFVGLFRVSKVENDESKEYLKKSITITGMIPDLKLETYSELEGEFVSHEKYGKQFKINSINYVIPTEKDGIIEFLSSSFIKGCGKKTAEAIVNIYGNDSINIIKDDINSLDIIPGMTLTKKQKIYDSLENYTKSSDIIIKIKEMGFSIEEAGKIYSKHKYDIDDILENNIYLLTDLIEFKRLDNLYLNSHEKNDELRIKACIKEGMKEISNNLGNTVYKLQEPFELLSKLYNINIEYDLYIKILNELAENLEVVIDDQLCYLQNIYEDEVDIATSLYAMSLNKIKEKDYSKELEELEERLNIKYNDDQKNAILKSLNSNVTIISGGPGTGKTTIINAITKLYISEKKLNNIGIVENIALLAPTGRAAKKMSTSTALPASTIHRYLKWNKDTETFGVDEHNKNPQKLIIVDEVSMVDNNLMASLLRGIESNVKLILVGDAFQLPSVGPGFILSDLIKSDLFNFIPLNYIYRQSDDSYIPYLAREIKNKDLCEEFMNKRDDYNFISCESKDIKGMIKKIVEAGIKKGFNENKLQVLAPIYKGDNGIDSLNELLSNIFNPYNNQNRITYGDIIYKEGDKILQLVNDADKDVFNGDIGYISRIYHVEKKEFIDIDFEGNRVTYNKKDLKNIKHAYAITIHKSQGSEFDHVIMPITYQYRSMLYNKLLYTGVSRAKKSLIIIGDPKVFYQGIYNDYGNERHTTLIDRLNDYFID